MAEGVSTRLSTTEGRKFGLTVGAAFLVLAAISRWRGHMLSAQVLATLGGMLIVLGVAVPSRLGPVFSGWMGLAHAMSKVTTPLFMGIVYFIVLTPTGLILRIFGRNPVAPKHSARTAWVPHEPRSEAADSMYRQF